MLFGGREPNSVVFCLVRFIAKNEDNFLLNFMTHINREAAEHKVGPRRQRGDGVEYEFMRNRLTLLNREAGFVRWEDNRFAMGLRHTSDSFAVRFSSTQTVYRRLYTADC